MKLRTIVPILLPTSCCLHVLFPRNCSNVIVYTFCSQVISHAQLFTRYGLHVIYVIGHMFVLFRYCSNFLQLCLDTVYSYKAKLFTLEDGK